MTGQVSYQAPKNYMALSEGAKTNCTEINEAIGSQNIPIEMTPFIRIIADCANAPAEKLEEAKETLKSELREKVTDWTFLDKYTHALSSPTSNLSSKSSLSSNFGTSTNTLFRNFYFRGSEFTTNSSKNNNLPLVNYKEAKNHFASRPLTLLSPHFQPDVSFIPSDPKTEPSMKDFEIQKPKSNFRQYKALIPIQHKIDTEEKPTSPIKAALITTGLNLMFSVALGAVAYASGAPTEGLITEIGQNAAITFGATLVGSYFAKSEYRVIRALEYLTFPTLLYGIGKAGLAAYNIGTVDGVSKAIKPILEETALRKWYKPWTWLKSKVPAQIVPFLKTQAHRNASFLAGLVSSKFFV